MRSKSSPVRIQRAGRESALARSLRFRGLTSESRKPMNLKRITKAPMITSAAKPNADANPTWERLTDAIQTGMQRMTRDTDVARRRRTVEAAIKICADSQTLTGDVIEAGASIPFALAFDDILDELLRLCKTF